LDSSCELPNDKNIVEAASDPRLRQAAGTLGVSGGNITVKHKMNEN
jgi:hypothetical protein